MLQRAIRLAHTAGASPVFVVLGAQRELIEDRIDFKAAKIVSNRKWQEGMGSSIRAGMELVTAEAPEAEGVLLMICDQPRVTAEHLRWMIDVFSQRPQSAVVSAYAGRRGTPAIFPRAAFAELAELRGDRGARGLLANPSWPVVEIPLAGGEIDIDQPEDLDRIR